MRKKDQLQFRKLFVFFLSFVLLIFNIPIQAHAASGDFSIDFAAAAPYSYNHLTGGGAFDDGTIGSRADVVESLEGGDFKCGDIVTYLVKIVVDDTESAGADAPQTIQLDFSFLADTTGQPGMALIDITAVKINYGTVEDLIPGEDNRDNGIDDNGGSTAELFDEHIVGTPFTAGAKLLGSVTIDDLERGETVILRIDVKLGCKPGSNPTGNLQADLQSAWLIATGAGPVTPAEAIPGGAQTIPFKQIGNIGAADIEIEKTVRVSGSADSYTESITILNGTAVQYRYVVTNLATTQPPGAPLYDVTVVDDNGTPSIPGDDFAVTLTTGLTDIDGDGHADDLAIGGTATGTAIRTITTTANTVVNTATASGKDAIYLPNTLTDTDTATVNVERPAISLEKTGTYVDQNGDGKYSAGDKITYAFRVENTGNVTLTNVRLTDPKITVTGGPIASLAPGAVNTTTFTGVYWLTQADIDAGTFTNIATVTGTPPRGTDVQDTDDDTQTFTRNPAIELLKTGTTVDENGDGIDNVGDKITYTFKVSNIGNVTLTNVTVTDKIGGVTISGGPIASLAPGSSNSVAFTGVYWLTQADIDAGTFTNVATATGTKPGGGTVKDDDDDTQTFEREPAIELVKTGTFVDFIANGIHNAGDKITYTFTVRNIGNVTLTNVMVTDPKITVIGGPIASLSPGAVNTSTFTGTYTITQADIDAGTFTNIATVTGTKPGGGTVSDTDDDTKNFDRLPSINLLKTGTFVDFIANGIHNAGDKITYAFTVTNTGNVTLANVRITDPKITVLGGPIASLAPGAVDTTTFTGTYTITQADIDAGTFTNTATVIGTPPSGPDVTDEDSDTQSFTKHPAILLEKTGTYVDFNKDGIYTAGDKITYTFSVTNTGNVTLTDVTVTDKIGGVMVTGTPIAILVPGAVDSASYTGSYILKQADIDAGTFTNIATATGSTPGGGSVSDDDDDTQQFTRNPALELVKSGTWMDGDADGYADVGETIHYTFTVKNIGNVTLHNVMVSDPKVTVVGGPTTLDVGETDTTTFSGSYQITQADIDAGFVHNAAIADSDESGPDDDEHTEPLPQHPALELDKSGTWIDGNADGYADAGETIHYTFTVKNTGNVTLHNVTVSDPKVTVTGGPTTLDVGETDTTTFSGSYQITQADIDAGFVYNAAIADSDESGPDDDEHTEPLPQHPDIKLIKTGTYVDENDDGMFNVGDKITYAFTVQNTGNVTLTDVMVADPTVFVMGSAIDSLLPGAVDTTTFTGVYWLTQADIDAGSFTNVAMVTGTPPIGSDVTDTDDDTQWFIRNPALELEKSGAWVDGDDDGYADVGETINYTFTVKNIGNVTLHNVTVSDPKVTVVGGPTTLDVGETDTTTFSGSYHITQADIDAGFVYNAAIADSDESDEDEDDDTEHLPRNPALELVKSGTWIDGNADGYADVGETINYSFTVKNTGNVTLHNVTVSDPKVTVAGGPTTLDVGETDTTTFSGSYHITQADIDAGFIYNAAIADSDESEEDEDDETEELPQNPALELVKSGTWIDGDADGYADVGEMINYTFTVENIGNVTLNNITVTDPKIPVITYVSGDDGDDKLQIDEIWTFTGSYMITQADIDAGSVYNLAIADSDESDDDDGDETVELPQNPAIHIVKTTNGGDGLDIPAGASVTWRYVVTNIGNVTLSEITVTDDQAVVPIYVSGDANLDGLLDLTESWIYEAHGMAIEGAYANTGTATGTPPEGDDVSDDDTNRYYGYVLGIHIEKDAANLTQNGDFNDYAELEEEEVARYRLTITNDSNVALINVIVTDTEAQPGTIVTIEGGGTLTWEAGSGELAELHLGSLAIGAKIVLTYDYRTLHRDIGVPIINTATVTAQPGEELDHSEYPGLFDEDDATISVEAIPLVTTSVAIVKKVRNQTAGGSFADLATGYAGDVFCYFVEIANDGETLLSNVALIDDRAVVGSQLIRSGDNAHLTWASDGTGKAKLVIGDLEPGESVSFTYTYTATINDEGETYINEVVVKAEFIPTVPGYENIPLEKADEAAITIFEPPPITGETEQTGQNGTGLLMLSAAAGLLIMRRRRWQHELLQEA